MMILGLQASPNRHTMELIATTQVISAHVAMIVKHYLACRRPDRLGAKVMPIIPTPAHATFPAAHAVEAFAVAEVLKRLVAYVSPPKAPHYPDVDKRQALLDKLAERISISRVVAGVHFPIDIWAGALLGRSIGELIIARCTKHSTKPECWTIRGYSYDVNSAKGESDFYIEKFKVGGDDHEYGVKRLKEPCEVCPSELFQWLWEKATHEFALNQ
jgi:PAP2 superfamily